MNVKHSAHSEVCCVRALPFVTGSWPPPSSMIAQDPFLAAVFLEDFSATLGVVIAACGIGLTQLTG